MISQFYILSPRGDTIITRDFRGDVTKGTAELLFKMAKVFKDYCGVLNEESIRKNFVLVYELLDEMVDYGFPQTTSTEVLKSAVRNEAVVVEAPKGFLSSLP